MSDRPKLGLALGAGSVRGLAHIGVIQVLQENKIPIDLIAGTSAGGMIGALYAAGVDFKLLEGLACSLKLKHIIDFVFPKTGLVGGQKLADLIALLTKNQDFKDLKIPLSLVACDIETGEKVIINQGNVALGVRATISIPGIFEPVRIGKRMLVDGALLDRVPVSVAREMGADLVIGVDVGYDLQPERVTNIFGVIMQAIDIMGMELLRARVVDADIMIRPPVGHIGSFKLHQAKECIELGRIAAEDAVDSIKELLESYKNKQD
ncbi:MAG TPA: patatin-like phospholipase family protein [Clostridia bacterium]|nr:patatin-like phospholipase family protein [Clostridia bacterium]